MRCRHAVWIDFFLLGSWWLTLMGPAAIAEVTDFGSRIPNVDELESGLILDKTRGIKILKPTEDLRTEGPAEEIKSISMELTFDFDSARLSELSKQVLTNLGAAIARPSLSDYRFRIEGHTDSTGRAKYNKWLSERRAQSVRSYLIGNARIPAKRLEALGMGEEVPKHGTAPDDPANRRVQITTLERLQQP